MEKVEGQKEMKTIKPINFKQLIEEFLRANKDEEIKALINRIMNEGEKQAIIQLDLDDILNFNEKLFFRFREKPFRTINEVKKSLVKIMKFYNQDIKNLFDKDKNGAIQGIHVIPDVSKVDDFIPEIADFSKDLNHYGFKLCKFKGRFRSIGIEKIQKAKKLKFECLVCGKNFEVNQSNENGRLKWPRFCINPQCKAKAKSDFKPKLRESETFTSGHFRISDLRIEKAYLNLNCEITDGFDYFNKKIEALRLNEEVEVIGVLIRNIPNKKENKLEEKIRVLEINPIKIKGLDKKIIKKLRKKLSEDPSYFEKLIDGIFPLTYLIDLHFPIKLLTTLSFVSGGSWNKKGNFRNTLNSIIGGKGETFKSSIFRDFERKVGKLDFYFHELSKDMTTAGLVGTTERSNNKTIPEIRYGIIPQNSNGCIVLDEFQKAKEEIREIFRCVEAGDLRFIQDALDPEAPAKGSIIISQNFMKTTTGAYNSHHTYLENLGWEEMNADTLLQRFDLRFTIENPDNFVLKWVNKNRRKFEKGRLIKEIAKSLEIEEYSFPTKVIKLSKEEKKNINIPTEIQILKKKIDYLHYNYFHKAKEFYRNINLTEGIKDIIDNVYLEILESPAKNIGQRALNTFRKLIKGIGALRLKEKTTLKDFNYVRKKCINYMIAFRDSDVIKNKKIDLNEIFRDIFRKECEEKNEIDIEILIRAIRLKIKRDYFSETDEESFNEEINDFIPPKYTLEGNYEFRKILSNNEDYINTKGFTIISKPGRGNKTRLVRKKETEVVENLNSSKKRGKRGKGDLSNLIEHSEFAKLNQEKKGLILEALGELREMFEESSKEKLEKKGLKQTIALKIETEESFIKKILDYFINEHILIKDGKKVKLHQEWK